MIFRESTFNLSHLVVFVFSPIQEYVEINHVTIGQYWSSQIVMKSFINFYKEPPVKCYSLTTEFGLS